MSQVEAPKGRTVSSCIETVIRFRPFLKSEVSGTEKAQSCAAFHKSGKKVQIKHGLETPKEFSFDTVLKTDVQQDAVFEAIGPTIVKNLMDGFNTTVICFGGPGAGKTYTCFSGSAIKPNVVSKSDGLLPRIVREAFNKIFDAAEDENSEFSMKFSCYEISPNEIVDLLNNQNDVECLVDEASNEVILHGLTEEYVASEEELFQLLQNGLDIRQERHSTFAEMIVSHHRVDTNTTLLSRLTFIDLDKSGQESFQEISNALANNVEIDYFSTSLKSVIFGRVFINSLVHGIACCSPATEIVKTDTLPILNFAEVIKKIDVLAHQNYVSEDHAEAIEDAISEEHSSIHNDLSDRQDSARSVDSGKGFDSARGLDSAREMTSELSIKFKELEAKYKDQTAELERLKNSERKAQQLLRHSLLTLRGQLSQVKVQHSQMQKQSLSALGSTKDALLESLSTQINTKMKHMVDRISTQVVSGGHIQLMEQERMQHKHELSKANDKINALTAERNEMQEQLSAKNAEIQKLNLSIIEITTERDDLQFELQNLELQVQNNLMRLKDAELQVADNSKQLTIKNDEIQSLQKQLQDQKEQVSNLSKELTERSSMTSSEEVETLRNRIREQENKLQLEIELFNQEKEYAREQLNFLQKSLEESQQEIKKLQEEKAKLRSDLQNTRTESKDSQEKPKLQEQPKETMENAIQTRQIQTAQRINELIQRFERKDITTPQIERKFTVRSKLNTFSDTEYKRMEKLYKDTESALAEEQKKSQKYQKEVQTLFEQIEKLRNTTVNKFELQQLQTTLNDSNEQLVAMRHKASAAELELVKIRQEATSDKEQLQRVTKQLEQLKIEYADLEQRNNKLDDELREERKYIQNQSDKRKTMQMSPLQLKPTDLNSVGLQALQEEFNEFKLKEDSFQNETKKLQQLIVDKNYEIENLQQQLNDVKQKVISLNKQNDDAEKEYSKSTSALSNQISTLQSQILELKSTIESLNQEKKQLNGEIEKLQSNLMEFGNRFERGHREKKDLEVKIEKLRSEKKDLEVKLALAEGKEIPIETSTSLEQETAQDNSLSKPETENVETSISPRKKVRIRQPTKIMIDQIQEQQRQLARQESEQQALKLHELSEKVKDLEQRNRAMSRVVEMEDLKARKKKKITKKDRTVQLEQDDDNKNDALAESVEQDEDLDDTVIIKEIESDSSEWIAIQNPLFNPVQVNSDYDDRPQIPSPRNNNLEPSDRKPSVFGQRTSSIFNAIKKISNKPTTTSKSTIPEFTSDSIDENTLKAGFLLKKGKNAVVENWKRHWFKLHHGHLLSNFIDLGDIKPLETIDLKGAQVTPCSDKAAQGRKYVFMITTTDSKHHYMAANNEYERKEWLETIKKCSE